MNDVVDGGGGGGRIRGGGGGGGGDGEWGALNWGALI